MKIDNRVTIGLALFFVLVSIVVADPCPKCGEICLCGNKILKPNCDNNVVGTPVVTVPPIISALSPIVQPTVPASSSSAAAASSSSTSNLDSKTSSSSSSSSSSSTTTTNTQQPGSAVVPVGSAVVPVGSAIVPVGSGTAASSAAASSAGGNQQPWNFVPNYLPYINNYPGYNYGGYPANYGYNYQPTPYYNTYPGLINQNLMYPTSYGLPQQTVVTPAAVGPATLTGAVSSAGASPAGAVASSGAGVVTVPKVTVPVVTVDNGIHYPAGTTLCLNGNNQPVIVPANGGGSSAASSSSSSSSGPSSSSSSAASSAATSGNSVSNGPIYYYDNNGNWRNINGDKVIEIDPCAELLKDELSRKRYFAGLPVVSKLNKNYYRNLDDCYYI